MTLDELHALKQWHQGHVRAHPFEKQVWDAVMTLWVMGWVSAPVACLIHLGWGAASGFALIFLPGRYVALRRRLHRAGILRCDWITALR